MSFYGLGLTASTYLSGQQVIWIQHGQEPSELWISFQTDCDTNDYEFMDISAVFRGATRQKTEYTGYGDWGITYYQRIPCKDIICNQYYPRYRWHKDMVVWHPAMTYNLLSDLTNNNSWSFENRKYDAVEIDLGVDRVYSNGEKYYLSRHTNVFIIYRPFYHITGIKSTKDGLVVSYNISDGWERTDDRFYVDSLISKDSSEYKLFARGVYGKLIAPGEFLIQHKDLIDTPKQGEDVRGNFFISTVFDPEPRNRSNFVSYDGSVADATKCNPIIVNPSEDGYSVRFQIVENKRGYLPVERVVVKMLPSIYEFDTKTSDTLPAIISMEPPLNTRVMFSVTPYGEDGTTNSTFYYVAEIEANYVILTSIDSGKSVYIRYNYLPSFTAKPDVNIVKFAGRERPSAFYGTGGTVEGSVTGTIVDNYYPNVDVPYNVEMQKSNDFESVHFFGDCLLRTPDSVRRLVSVSSIDVNTKSVEMLHVKDVSIKMTEVR